MPFDWKPFEMGTGEFVKFDAPGDEIVGRIVAIRKHTFDEDKGPVVLIDIAPKGGGDNVTLSVDKVDLRAKLAVIAPQVSDMLAVKFTGVEKMPKGQKKVFSVKHKVGDRVEPEPELDDFDDFGTPVADTADLSEYSEEPF